VCGERKEESENMGYVEREGAKGHALAARSMRSGSGLGSLGREEDCKMEASGAYRGSRRCDGIRVGFLGSEEDS